MTAGRRKIFLLALAIWPVFLMTAMALGAVREGVIAPAPGEQAAHVVGTLLFISLMLAIMWIFVGRIRTVCRTKGLWLTGLMWTARPVPWLLLIIPGLWSLVGSSAAVLLSIREDSCLLIAGIVGVSGVLLKNPRLDCTVDEFPSYSHQNSPAPSDFFEASLPPALTL